MSSILSHRVPVLLSGLLLSGMLGILYAWSIFVLPLEQTFGWNRDQTAMTFTLTMIFFGLGMFLGGRGLDNPILGPRLTCAIGGCLVSGGFFLASFSDSLAWLYISYGVMGGFGLGIANSVPTAVCLRWFPNQRGKTSGVLSTSLAFGTFFLGVQGASYLISLLGWETTFRLIALALFLVSIIATIFLHFPTYSKPSPPTDSDIPIWGYDLRQATSTLSFWGVLLWGFFLQFGGLMVITHLVPLAIEKGANDYQSAIAIGIFSICNGIGRLAFGALWDHYGQFISMGLNSTITAMGLLGLAILPDLLGIGGLWGAVALVGFGFGGIAPHLATTMSSFFGLRHFGGIYGFAAISFMIAALTAPLIGSHIYTLSGSYTTALYGAAALTLPCIFLTFILKPPLLVKEKDI